MQTTHSNSSDLRQRKINLLQMVAKLQNDIDFTPNNPDEKNTLIKELRLRKKELQAEKGKHLHQWPLSEKRPELQASMPAEAGLVWTIPASQRHSAEEFVTPKRLPYSPTKILNKPLSVSFSPWKSRSYGLSGSPEKRYA